MMICYLDGLDYDCLPDNCPFIDEPTESTIVN